MNHYFYMLCLPPLGPRRWSLKASNALESALTTPNLLVLLSLADEVSSYTTVCRDEFTTDLQRVTLRDALRRMEKIMKCYNEEGDNSRVRNQLTRDLVEKVSKWGQLHEDEELRKVMGMDPATGENCPNLPGDPKLFGYQPDPFMGQDPFWFDYRPDQDGGGNAA